MEKELDSYKNADCESDLESIISENNKSFDDWDDDDDDDDDDAFAQFYRISQAKLSALLEDTEMRLHQSSNSQDTTLTSTTSTISRRNSLEKRYNFATHNHPPCNHLAPRISEWTSQFTYLRIQGTSIQKKNLIDQNILDGIGDADEKYSVDEEHDAAGLENYEKKVEFYEMMFYAIDRRKEKTQLSFEEKICIVGYPLSALLTNVMEEEEVFASHGVHEEIIEMSSNEECDEVFSPSDSKYPIPPTAEDAICNEIKEELLEKTWKLIVPKLGNLLRYVVQETIPKNKKKANSAPVGSAFQLCLSSKRGTLQSRRNFRSISVGPGTSFKQYQSNKKKVNK